MTDYIDQYPPDGWPDDWWEASVSTMSYNGKVYGLPYDWATNGLYVNRDMMDPLMEYPVSDDWTFDDLTDIAIGATKEEDGRRPSASPWHLAPITCGAFAKSFGGEFFDENGPSRNSPIPRPLQPCNGRGTCAGSTRPCRPRR